MAQALLPTAAVLVHVSWSPAIGLHGGDGTRPIAESALRHNYRDRLLVTCLLWLAASTFTTSTPTNEVNHHPDGSRSRSLIHLWTFLVFFGNVLSSCCLATLYARTKKGLNNAAITSPPRVRCTGTFFRTPPPWWWILEALTTSLAPSALAALWWNILCLSLASDNDELSSSSSNPSSKGSSSSSSCSCSIWVALLVGTLLVIYQCSRRWRMHSPWTLRDPPAYQLDQYGWSSSPPLPPFNEYQWFDWTPHQVLLWMQSIWKQECCRRPQDPDMTATNLNNDDFYKDVNENNAAELFPWNRLAREHIRGSQLDRLTRSELRSMGLPYGIAQAMMDQIDDLTCKYPHPHRRSNDYPANGTTSWLAQHDEQYNNRRYTSSAEQSQRETSSARRRPTREALDTDETKLADHELDVEMMDENMQRQAQKVMRERFGLELPPIRQRRDRPPPMPEQLLPENETKPSEILPLPLPPSRRDDDTWIALPPALLENAPPYIAEIVHTRPDLIQTVLRARKMKEQQLATSLRPLFEGSASAPDQDDGDANSEEEVDSDNERAGLLHNSPSQQYKSTF